MNDMRPTNGDPPSVSGVEKINQLVRAGVVGLLTLGFVGVFVWGALDGNKIVVSSDAFISVLMAAITWWFKSRDDQQRRTDMVPPPGTVTTTTTPPGTVTATAIQPTPGGGTTP